MSSILAIVAAVLQIIAYILKQTPSKTKTEVIQGIWANRKVKRDEAIINNKNDKITSDTSDIIDGLDGLSKKNSNSTGK